MKMDFQFKVYFPWESDFGREDAAVPEQDVWRPPADIMETPEEFFIKMELPGIEKDEIEIKIVDNRLEVKGERKFEKKVGNVKVIKTEIPYGFFLRTFKLPSKIDSEKVEARLDNGVLVIRVPKYSVKVTIEGE